MSWVIVRDVTEATELERRLEQTVRQLQTALDSLIVIEQAKGLVAGLHGIDTETAFERLLSYARSHHAKLHDIAEAVINR